MKRVIKEDYLSTAAELRPFYQYPFPDTAFTQIMQDKSRDSIDRKTLREDLEEQNSGLTLSEATRENIRKIGEEGTFTLTTGHQLGILGGPMFTLYKILTVIRLAEDLQAKHPENNFVPVFWMASEDHDAAEVNHYYTSFAEKVSYIGAISGAVGRHVLEPSISEVIPEAYQAFYQPGIEMREAFRALINHLFGKYGLVIIDGDSPTLKRLFIPVLKKELMDRPTEGLVQKASEALTAEGYHAQVFPREINLFYLDDRRRDRIVWKEDHFTILGSEKNFTEEEILAELQRHPEKFSPNAILRPLYQEYLLPNLAYAGGWGEIAYWMQIKEVFSHFGVNYPMLIPRMNATLIPKSLLSRWEELGFAPADFTKEIHLLNDQYLPNLWEGSGYPEYEKAFAEVYQKLSDYVSQFEPTLARSVEAEQAKTSKLLEKMEKKVKRAVRNRHPKVFAEIESIKNQVQPGKSLQERTLNFSTFPLEAEKLVGLLHSNCHPLDPSHNWISLT